MENWLQAEAQLMAARKPVPETKPLYKEMPKPTARA